MPALAEYVHRPSVPETLRPTDFFDAIKRPDLRERLCSTNSIASVSMENDIFGNAFAGGLGILEGCKFQQAARLGIPYVSVNLFPPTRWTQEISMVQDNGNARFISKEVEYQVHPQEAGFKREPFTVTLKTNGDQPQIEVWTKREGSALNVVLYESGLGRQYGGATNSDHRLYQNVVLGFGGYKAVKQLGLEPSVLLLNESPTFGYALAELDELCINGLSFPEALKIVREKYKYINHTLEQYTEAEFTENKFNEYVMKNVNSNDIKQWIKVMFDSNGGRLKLSTLATALTRRRAGVSKLHAEVASRQFKDEQGNNVTFEPITNGISFDRWIYREMLRMYREAGIIDAYDLPASDYTDKIRALPAAELKANKNQARRELREVLRVRKDQYGQGVDIPEDAKIAVWAKRYVAYKRPELLLENPDELARILQEENMHIVFSGKVPGMGADFDNLLRTIHGNDVLRARVHFIADYGKDLSGPLVAGADIWLNTPVVGKEACGTSWEKAIGNNAILISTEDGGVADKKPATYLKIVGNTYQEEAQSLRLQLVKASKIMDGTPEDKEGASIAWDGFVKTQLITYLPTMSASRMHMDYLNFEFPSQELLPKQGEVFQHAA